MPCLNNAEVISVVRVIVETSYDPPFTDEEWDAMNTRATPCFQARNVTWIRSYVSGDRTRSVCELEAPDAETIREAYRRADVPFDRLWVATLVEP